MKKIGMILVVIGTILTMAGCGREVACEPISPNVVWYIDGLDLEDPYEAHLVETDEGRLLTITNREDPDDWCVVSPLVDGDGELCSYWIQDQSGEYIYWG